MKSPARPAGHGRLATVGIVDWCHLYEDYLDTIGVSFEAFRDEMTGGWLFGYIKALGAVGVQSVFLCVSSRVTAPWRFTHRPTGAQVCVLPAPRLYRAIRRRVLNPYADTLEEAVGEVRGIRRAVFAGLKDLAPYVVTPLGLLARELRRAGCDAVLCQDYEHARFDACVALGRLLHLPVFATFQGGDSHLSRWERLFRRRSLRTCAGLIIATEREARRVRDRYGVPPGRLARIFNPLDLGLWQPMDRVEARAALGLPAGARIAICHGRISLRRKGLDLLVEAWSRVCRERPDRDLRLLLVGTGSDADELRRLIALHELRGIHWVNEHVRDRNAIRRYISAADVYVLSSRHEGFPVAPIEAMACALPIVAADAPGVQDILENGEGSGGLVVPRGDSAAIAQALGRVIDHENWGRELGTRARRRVEAAFSLEAVGAQVHDFLLNPAGGRWAESMNASRAAASGAPLGAWRTDNRTAQDRGTGETQ